MENRDSGADRRKTNRIYASFVEYCRAEDKSSKKLQAFTENVSISGICILVNEEIEIGSSLSVTIYLLDGSNPIETKGMVVWTRPSTFLNVTDSKHCDAGIKFVEISKQDRDRLYRYAIKYANERPPSKK